MHLLINIEDLSVVVKCVCVWEREREREREREKKQQQKTHRERERERERKREYTYRSSVSWINLADVTAAKTRDITNKTEVMYVFIISEKRTN